MFQRASGPWLPVPCQWWPRAARLGQSTDSSLPVRSLPRRRLGAEGGARQPESSTGVLYRVRGARSIVTRNADHARAQAAFGNLRGYNKSILETLAIYLRVLLNKSTHKLRLKHGVIYGGPLSHVKRTQVRKLHPRLRAGNSSLNFISKSKMTVMAHIFVTLACY